tara:strand:- start:416 stop:895 length:480 start_codon:yes stop_codon:yes gene_type:complete
MANVDDTVFNHMKTSNKQASDRLFEQGRVFAESEYNMNATSKERKLYDAQAYEILSQLYDEDKKKDKFQTLNFSQFLENLDNDYLEEKFLHSRKDDPKYYSKAGKLLRNVYSGDVEQLKLSAFNMESQMVPRGPGPDSLYTPKRDRSNVSIKAPGAERY